MKKVRLQFMVDPDELREKAYIRDPVRIRITRPRTIFLLGVLGESGRKLVGGGICFYFERRLAEGLVKSGVAEFAPKNGEGGGCDG